MSIYPVELELIIPRLGWTLIHSLWQGMLAAAVLVVVLRAVSDARSRIRYFISCVALVLVLFSAIATYCLLGEKVQPVTTSSSAVAPSMPHVASAAPFALPPAVSTAPAINTDHEAMLRFLVFAWGMGVAFVSAWHLFGWISLRRLSHGEPLLALEPTMARLRRQLKIRQMVRLIETTRLNVPAVVGAFRPIILLPIGLLSELSPQQIEAILLHELAHIARHDYLVNLFQAAIEALMFYHPAVWWISSQIRREREHCCDDIAASKCSNTRLYAGTLLALEQRRSPTGMLALAATDGILLSRVRRILKARSNPIHRPVRSLATALLLLACLGLPFVAVAQQKPTTAPVTRPVADSGSAAKGVYSEILPEDLKTPVEEPYRLGPTDMVQLSITGPNASDNTKEIRFAVDALVKAMSLPSPLKIEGLTVPEAEEAISKALKDGNVLNHRKINIKIAEMRGRTFAVLGKVDQPGQYAIANADLRLSTALSWTMKGNRLKDSLYLTLIRAAPSGQKNRVLSIPIAKLNAGDPQVNVVVRSGDTIIVNDQDFVAQPTTAPAKAESGSGEYYLAGQVQRSGVYALSGRKVTVKQAIVSAGVKAETNDAYVTVIRRSRSGEDEASFVLKNVRYQDLSKDNQGDAYIEDNDIIRINEKPVKSRYSAKEVLSNVGENEYYIYGDVKRVGVYSLNNRKINLQQAIIAAGGPERNVFISVIRQVDKGKRDFVLLNARIEDLISGDQPDIYLQENDQVRVSKEPERFAATQAAPPSVQGESTAPSVILPGPTDEIEPGRDMVFRADGNTVVMTLPDGKTFRRDQYIVKAEGENKTIFTAVDGLLELRIGGVLTLRAAEFHCGPKRASGASIKPVSGERGRVPSSR